MPNGRGEHVLTQPASSSAGQQMEGSVKCSCSCLVVGLDGKSCMGFSLMNFDQKNTTSMQKGIKQRKEHSRQCLRKGIWEDGSIDRL